MNASASQRFLADRVMTASPARRIVMMYDRALLDLARADACAESGDTVAASNHLMHALDILLELRGTLDPSAWVGAESLAGLYDWTMGEIVACRTGTGLQRLAPVREVLSTLRAAWDRAAEDLAASAPRTLGSVV